MNLLIFTERVRGLAGLTFLLTGLGVGATARPLQFNRDIRPILSEHCFSCHGFDAKKRKGELRLDLAVHAHGAGESDLKALVPGKPEESEVWRRLTTDDLDDRMPPKSHKKRLSSEQVATLKQWIEEGANYQKHWAFEAPVVEGKANGPNRIDQYLSRAWGERDLKPQQEAGRHTLIRRVSFATTGLPPSLEAIDRFVNDREPGAYERMVDRYLASRHFGEEMARHWLDVARYADTHGMHLDNERQMFAYRDWVVKAFNDNKSYDEFTIEQIAGDLLPNPRVDQLVATGFNRCNITTGEGGTIPEEFVFRYAVERASTTAQTWMGLTMGCAVCHDHKYDPITAKDFYSFYAFFHSNADPALDGNALLTRPVVRVTPPDYEKTKASYQKRRSEVQGRMDQLAAKTEYKDPAAVKPRPAPKAQEDVWFDDQFPKGAQVGQTGHATSLVESPEPVFSGKRALKRSGPGLAQDFYEKGAAPLAVPAGGVFFVHVYLDPKSPPKEVMLQFNTGAWSHRAYWGANVIPWGKDGTSERFHAGKLPETGKWVRLEVAADKMGLGAGAQVKGFAFTVQDGTTYFDKLGVEGRSDPASDPARSLLAWRTAAKGKDTPGLAGDLNGLLKKGAAFNAEQEERLRRHYLQEICLETKEQFAAPKAELAKIDKEQKDYEAKFPSTFIYRDLPKPRDSFVMMRGQYNKPGDKVRPGTPGILPPLTKAQPDGRANRLDLARWLVAKENPLTARVAVNRFWQQFFGVGLVKTGHDFGTQGEVPSHPELLDWLAVRFQADGWDVKKLVRLFLTSDAFQRSSAAPGEHWLRDPENRYLARGPRFRLDAEQLRDQALQAGGLLVKRMGGKGDRTYQPPNIWEPVGFRGSNTAKYRRDNGEALYRRSLYVFLKRTAPAPFLENFNAPNREVACYRRERTNTPLQALQLLNDVQFFEAARGLATRVMAGAATTEDRLHFAYRSVVSRSASSDELALLRPFYERTLARYRADAKAAAAAIRFGDSKPPEGVDEPQLAAWTVMANLILNLDEAIVRN